MDGSRDAIEVLLAEDNEDDVLLLRETLEGTGLLRILNVVKDGVEAMACLLRKDDYRDARLPQIVLLDIKMPKKDGFEVLHEIKSDPTLKAMPVIMLTTSTNHDDVVRSYAAGACSFISKPASPDSMQDLAAYFSYYWTRVANLPSL